MSTVPVEAAEKHVSEQESDNGVSMSASRHSLPKLNSSSKFKDIHPETEVEVEIPKPKHDMSPSARLPESTLMVADGAFNSDCPSKSKHARPSRGKAVASEACIVEHDQRLIDPSIAAGKAEEPGDVEQNSHRVLSKSAQAEERSNAKEDISMTEALVVIDTGNDFANSGQDPPESIVPSMSTQCEMVEKANGDAKQQGCSANVQAATEKEENAQTELSVNAQYVLAEAQVPEQTSVEEQKQDTGSAKTQLASKLFAEDGGGCATQIGVETACLPSEPKENASANTLGRGDDIPVPLLLTEDVGEGASDDVEGQRLNELNATSIVALQKFAVDESEEQSSSNLKSTPNGVEAVEDSCVKEPDMAKAIPESHSTVAGVPDHKLDWMYPKAEDTPSVDNLILDVNLSGSPHDLKDDACAEEQKPHKPDLHFASKVTDTVEEFYVKDNDVEPENPCSPSNARELLDGCAGDDDDCVKADSSSQSKLTLAAESQIEEADDGNRPLKDDTRSDKQDLDVAEVRSRQSNVERGRLHGRKGSYRQPRRSWRGRRDFLDREERLRRKGLFEGNSAMQYLYCSGRNQGAASAEFGSPAGGFGDVLQPYDERVLRGANWAIGTPPMGMAFRFYPVDRKSVV